MYAPKLTPSEAKEYLELDQMWEKDALGLLNGEHGNRYRELSHQACRSGMNMREIRKVAKQESVS